MRVGTLCYDTHQGLGYLAHDFYLNGVVTNPIIVSHKRKPANWYPGKPRLNSLDVDSIAMHFRGLDAALFFETPFTWEIFGKLRQMRVRSILMPMHECMPAAWAGEPDAIINPSTLDQDCFSRGQYLPVPVNVPWRKRDLALRFVHNAGNGGLRGRNGTLELIKALQFVESPLHLTIRMQEPAKNVLDELRKPIPSHITLEIEGHVSREQLYDSGDVFIFPEKFNGLSLPLQEAYASGMTVMATDRHPMNQWLPRHMLIRTFGSHEARISGRYQTFQEAEIEPRDIATKIDQYYGHRICDESEMGREWAEQHSWTVLKPKYMEILS